MWYVLDQSIRHVVETVGALPPEQGGALLGIPGRPVVTTFMFDPDGVATAISYQPSRTLANRVRDAELAQGLEFKGMLHSHPGALDHPSDGDAGELEVGLERNPKLGSYLCVILPQKAVSNGASHGVAWGQHRLLFFAAKRSRVGKVRVTSVRVSSIPLERDLTKTALALKVPTAPELAVTWAHHSPMLAGMLRLDGSSILLLASELYPLIPPLVLLSMEGGQTEQISCPWDLELDPAERLIRALKQAIHPPGPYHKTFGLPDRGPLTTDPERARLAGWSALFSGVNPANSTSEIHQSLFERSPRHLAHELPRRQVLIVGLGSGGGYMAEQLARSGVGNLIMVDAECVELDNLCRSPYELADVGHSKTSALARRLLRINPRVNVEIHNQIVQDFDKRDLDAVVSRADLVIASTDDLKAQAILNAFAYARAKPALFPGAYKEAKGGEIIVVVPPVTPCYICATSIRHEQPAAVSPDIDYSTGRMIGEVGLSADVHHIASAAVKFALALLAPQEPDLASLLIPVFEGANYITLSNAPGFWFFPKIFSNTPAYAFQSVWMHSTRREGCPVCGSKGTRVDPLQIPLKTPSAAEIRAALKRKKGRSKRTAQRTQIHRGAIKLHNAP